MLSPHRSIDIEFLIVLLVFLKVKPITLKNGIRGRRGFLIFSSFPNHDAKENEWKENKNKERNTRADCIREG